MTAWPAGGEPVDDWPEEPAAPAGPAPSTQRAEEQHAEREAAWVGKDEPATLADMMLTGATYRQLDYWWRTGLFRKPEDPERPPNTGSGRPRAWTGREQQIAALMVRLIHTGIAPSLAARMARDSVDNGARRVTTEDGITISWSGVA